jgi:hypothetical protein
LIGQSQSHQSSLQLIPERREPPSAEQREVPVGPLEQFIRRKELYQTTLTLHKDTKLRCEAEIVIAKQTRICPHCPHTFSNNNDLLRRHLWDHYICFVCECGYYYPTYETFSSHQKWKHGSTEHDHRRIDRQFFSKALHEISAQLPAEFPHPVLSNANTAASIQEMARPPQRQAKAISPPKPAKARKPTTTKSAPGAKPGNAPPITSRLGAPVTKTPPATITAPQPVIAPPDNRRSGFKPANRPANVLKAIQPPLTVHKVQVQTKHQATSPLKVTQAIKYRKTDVHQLIGQDTRRIQELRKRNHEYQKQIAENSAEIDRLLHQINHHASRLVGENVENYKY